MRWCAVMEQCGVPLSDDIKDEMYLDKSPEYWAGWALCYYQWITGYTFSHIHRAVPISELLGMYPALHEADITKFADIMHEKMKAAYPETNLYCAPVKFAVRPDCGPPAK
nr:hypothetical protein [uncultured Acetatifactor sp.]